MKKAIGSHIKRNEIRYLAFLFGTASLSIFCIGIAFMFNGAIESSFGMFAGGFGMIALSFIVAAAMSKLFVKKK
ncbi:hypothetical protein [Sulfurovum sp.]|jgi:hypothetical protein|uniref:hypothetical protein n=1 Tax=Sulfurovum sp. TaxID=1969726 RepID=UPI002A35E145|nr:hypothetical protein [Sulfurovum sp.]MDY0403405.1 hypothetical protein [Sulfurovum sp.]